MEINGISFITSKEAAKKAGYSPDYIARLARERKVVGTQIDRQWFIDPGSLERFLESTRIEKEARKRQLQAERSEERRLREEQGEISGRIHKRVHQGSLEALAKAGVITLVGTLIGTSVLSLYSSLAEDSQRSAGVAQVTAPVPENEPVPDTTSLPPVTKSTEKPIDIADGVILLRPDTSESQVERIQALFSDPVTVEFKDDRIGVVKVTEEGKEVEYPVVILPDN